jgi:hypothetical protein
MSPPATLHASFSARVPRECLPKIFEFLSLVVRASTPFNFKPSVGAIKVTVSESFALEAFPDGAVIRRMTYVLALVADREEDDAVF